MQRDQLPFTVSPVIRWKVERIFARTDGKSKESKTRISPSEKHSAFSSPKNEPARILAKARGKVRSLIAAWQPGPLFLFEYYLSTDLEGKGFSLRQSF